MCQYHMTVGHTPFIYVPFTCPIDNLHISGMEANIRVLWIQNSSSHSALVVNSMELLWLAATMCLYKTKVARVIRSVDAKVNLSKSWTDSLLCNRKFNLFLTFLTRGSSAQNIFWGGSWILAFKDPFGGLFGTDFLAFCLFVFCLFFYTVSHLSW